MSAELVTAPTPAQRAEMIGDAALAVLAAEGSRGLTHRAIDRWLCWPEGTTSRYHRTRESLMNAAVQRLVEVEVVHVEGWQRNTEASRGTSHEDVARILRKTYQEWTEDGYRQIARYELSLEGRRRPTVHEAIVAGRARLNDSVERLLRGAGCSNSSVHGTALVSLLDGLCHDELLHPEIAVERDDVEGVFLMWLQSC
jgi:DNA-binding transcriptional regulator YbjK